MLKKVLKYNMVSEAPSSTCVPSKNFKANLKLPLRTLEDVGRTEMELKNATTRKKYVSRQRIYTIFKGILYTHLLIIKNEHFSQAPMFMFSYFTLMAMKRTYSLLLK